MAFATCSATRMRGELTLFRRRKVSLLGCGTSRDGSASRDRRVGKDAWPRVLNNPGSKSFFSYVGLMKLLDAPADLSETARAAWPGLVSDLRAVGCGAEPDLLLLANLLRAVDRLADVRAVLASEGLTVSGSKGQSRPHPLLSTEADLRREIADGFERLQLARGRTAAHGRDWRIQVGPDGRLKPSEGP